MKVTAKIKIYSILSWILIVLTLLLAIVDQLRSEVFNPLGFITGIILQPYFWIALILRWRIKENKVIKSMQSDKSVYTISSGLLLFVGYIFFMSGLIYKIPFSSVMGMILALFGSIWLIFSS